MAQKRVKKEDRNQAYVPRSFSESKYEMGKCWGLSTSMPRKVNPLPKVSLAFLAQLRLASRLCVLPGSFCPFCRLLDGSRNEPREQRRCRNAKGARALGRVTRRTGACTAPQSLLLTLPADWPLACKRER